MGSWLRSLKSRLRAGISCSLGRYGVEVRLLRHERTSRQEPDDCTAAAVLMRHAEHLLQRVPELQRFGFSLTEANAAELLAFFNDRAAFHDCEAEHTSERLALYRLRDATWDEALREQVSRLIAVNEFRHGILGNAGWASHDAEFRTRVEQERQQYAAWYEQREEPLKLPPRERGTTLSYYFRNHPKLIRGKSVLHVAPEKSLQKWFLEQRAKLKVDYVTVDAFHHRAEMKRDLTSMPDLEDGCFDVVICHRVLEHILDDRAAIDELFRVTAPGGVLNVSVPQWHHAESIEWLVPDTVHYGHVRQYGRDFVDRLEAAGFEVELAAWLLERTADEYRRNHASPLRVYQAHKPADLQTRAA